MGNSQSSQTSQPTTSPTPTGSRRFGSPRPRTSSAAASSVSGSPKRSSSFKRTTTRSSRRESPHPHQQQQYQNQQPTSSSVSSRSRVRSPIPTGSKLAPREREIIDAWEREMRERDARELKEAKEKEKSAAGVHRSLQTKKKSLELPDLALTQVTTPTPTPVLTPMPTMPTMAIPIPGPGRPAPVRSTSRSRSPSPSPKPTPPTTEYPRIVVRSSIPFPANLLVAQAKAAQVKISDNDITDNNQITSPSPQIQLQIPISPPANRVNPQPSEGEPTYLVRISWHGGGEEVYLTRAGDDDWNGRRRMEREESELELDGQNQEEHEQHIEAGKSQQHPASSSTFSTIIALPRGTHHLRFLVDGQPRVADDLPTAVDDNGSLANYVAVGLSAGDSPQVVDTNDTSDTVDVVEVMEVESEKTPRPTDVSTFDVLPTRVDSHSSFWSENEYGEGGSRPPSLSSSPQAMTSVDANRSNGGGNPNTNLQLQQPKIRTKKVPYVRKWTTEIPLELLEAAADEESFLAYQNEVENAHASGHRIHITGFVPLPNIPPAPRLPRYLDKLILNTPVVPPIAKNGSPNQSGTGSPRTAFVPSPVGGASPSGSMGEGAGGDRIGEGDRAGMAGIGAGLGERTMRDNRERERDGRDGSRPREGSRDRREGRNSKDFREGRDSREGRRREREWKSMSLVMAEGEGGDVERDKVNNNNMDRPLPITTASGTDVSQSSHPLPSTQNSTMPSIPEPPNSIHISTNYANAIPSIADDTSVLPVPSHVVLHHLCTSAMRNGVLAVGEATRYRKKFVTTVYYKPAS